MSRLLTVVAIALVAPLPVTIASPATPWFTQDPRTLPQGGFRVEEHFLWSDINRSLVNGHEVPLAAGRNARSATLLTRVRYGVRDDLTVYVDVPWVAKRLTLVDGSEDSNGGLGDLTILAKYRYRDDKEARTRQAFSLWVKPKTGEYRDLPPLLATGSGTTDLGVVHLWEWDHGENRFQAGLGYAFTGTRDDTGRHDGHSVLFNAAAEHQIADSPFSLVCEVNGRYKAHAHQSGDRLPDSEAWVVSLSPGVQWVRPAGKGKVAVAEAGVQVPVIERGNLPAIPDYTAYVGGYVTF